MDKEKNEQVIIFKNDPVAEKKGFSWGDYGHQVNRFKYWILGITLVFAVIGYLLLSLYWNPRHKVSTSRFQLSLPVETIYQETGELQEINYLNGNPYSLYDIVSRDNIEDVVEHSLDEEGNPLFSIDVDKLVRENGISIQYANDSEGKPTSPSAFTYVLTIEDRYVGSSEEVSLFVDALLQNIIDKATQAIPSNILSNALPSDGLDNAYSLIQQMKTQHQQIDTLYQELMESFGSYVRVEVDGTTMTLSNFYSQRFSPSYRSASGVGNVFGDLADELLANGYGRYDSEDIPGSIESLKKSGNALDNRKESLERNVASLKQTIASINSLIGSDTTPTPELQSYYLESLAQLSSARQEMDVVLAQLSILGYTVTPTEEDQYEVTLSRYDEIGEEDYGTIQRLEAMGAGVNQSAWAATNEAFFQKLDTLVSTLGDDTERANSIYRNLYLSRQSSVIYAYPNRITTTGTTNAFLGAALGLILGFLLSSVALSAYGYLRDKKQDGKPSGALPETETQEKDEGKDEQTPVDPANPQ